MAARSETTATSMLCCILLVASVVHNLLVISFLGEQVPACAGVQLPSYSFPEKFSSFSFMTLLTKAEVIAALVKVRAECNKVRGCGHILSHYSILFNRVSVLPCCSTCLQVLMLPPMLKRRLIALQYKASLACLMPDLSLSTGWQDKPFQFLVYKEQLR